MLEMLEGRWLPASNGSAALVADILPGSTGSNPADYVVVNNTLYFTANDGVHGTELYRSDGTPDGTVLVKDINPGSGGSGPFDLTPVGATLYFRADDGIHGQELWKTDGTAAGTVLVKDINPGSGGSTPSSNSDDQTLADINGTLFFSAGDGVHGLALWKSNGTAAGTVLVSDSCWGPQGLTNFNGVALFSAFDGKHGQELWKSDGTAKGTVLVKDIWKGTSTWIGGFDGGSYTVINSSNPFGFTNVNGTLFFAAADGYVPNTLSLAFHLYRTDGTAGGTRPVSDVVLVSGGLLKVGGTVFFAGYDSANVPGLYRSDGTTAGTVQVFQGGAYGLTDVNGTIFFGTSDTAHGRALGKSDGTVAGTVLVKIIYSGTDLPGPSELTNVNGLLYFSADDGVHGRELWQSDGTETGTVMVQDINPGSAASDPQDLVAMNNKLYFSAADGTHGRELWDPPAVPTDGRSVAATPPGSETLLQFTGHGSGGFTDAAGDFFDTGIATHLGAFTHYGTLVLTPTDDPFVFAVSGRTVYQAANGDLLYAVTDGTLNVLTGVATGTDTWDGGTGRFADASGVVDLSAQLFPDGSMTFRLLGSIAFEDGQLTPAIQVTNPGGRR